MLVSVPLKSDKLCLLGILNTALNSDININNKSVFYRSGLYALEVISSYEHIIIPESLFLSL